MVFIKNKRGKLNNYLLLIGSIYIILNFDYIISNFIDVIYKVLFQKLMKKKINIHIETFGLY